MEYILHYGVLGMKWGVRRYQYRNGRLTPAGQKHYSKGSSRNTNPQSKSKASAKDVAKQTRSGSDSLVSRNANRKVSDISQGSATAVVATVAVYAALIAVSAKSSKERAKKMEQQFREQQAQQRQTLYDERAIKSLDEAPKIEQLQPARENAKVTNPDFPQDGTTQNCTFCTTAMALREKGFDVVATKTVNPMIAEDVFKDAFNAETVKGSKKQSPQSFTSELAKQGDGAYGQMVVRWKYGGGHSIFYKVENGKTHIYDGQSGEEYTASANREKQLYNAIQGGEKLEYTRLDNCEPTEKALAFVEPRKKN